MTPPSTALPVATLLLVASQVLAACAAPPAPRVHLADIHGLAVDPARSDVLYVATHHGLFRAERDVVWSAVTRDPFDMMGFTVHPSNASVMFASGHPRTGGLLGVAQSTDAGVTWKVIALAGQVDFHALAVSAANPDRLWGYFHAAVQRSDDAGVTWSRSSSSPPPSVVAFASSAADADVLYAAGPQGVFRSRDGGASFRPLYTNASGASALASTPSGADVLVAYFDRGGLLRSTDAGATWKSLNLTFASGDAAAAIAIDPQQADTVYVGSRTALLKKTPDGGATWMDVRP